MNSAKAVNTDIQNVDIAIVGGGIVGLSIALSLAQSLKQLKGDNVSIALIDNQPGKDKLSSFKGQDSVFDSRVSALTVASESLLSILGVWENIRSIRACPYAEMHVWDADGTGSIHFSAADIQELRLGHIVENRLIVAALNEALMGQENVEFFRPDSIVTLEKVQSDASSFSHTLSLESGRRLDCKLLIGADGGNSFIRSQAGFKLKEWDYQHKAIVCTVKTEEPHNYTASQCFMPSGPLAFLPLLEAGFKVSEPQYYSSIVWSCVPQKAEELMAMDDDEFASILAESFEYKLGKIESVQARFCFPLTQRHSVDYIQDGLALIGDAAHTIHPLAGQGVNLGLMDVAALNEVLTAAINKGEDYSSQQVLSRYQRKRKAGNLGMMLAMEGFKRLFASDDLSLRWLRNFGVSGVDNMPAIKNQLMKKAMGL